MDFKVLVVDDEQLARTHLKKALTSCGVTDILEAKSAAEALQMVEDEHPDLMLVDIQMPGLNGMQLASAIGEMDDTPLIAFVTGYSEHALEAFEHEAIDYLLKPVSAERLAQTVLRAKQRTKRESSANIPLPQLKRLPVRGDYAVKLVKLDEVDFFMARNKRVYVRCGGEELRTYYTLSKLEQVLPADTFIRIHDSFIVNIEKIDQLVFLGNHSYELLLTDKQRIPVARTRYAALQKVIGIAP